VTLPFAPSEVFVSHFAVDVLMGPVGAQKALKGIYDAPSTDSDSPGMMGVSQTYPRLKCRDVDLPPVFAGMRVEIYLNGAERNTTVFELFDSQPDGTGMTICYLHRASDAPSTRPY
jgi:hypothetical protein